jgi:hypothetical protein
VSQMITRMNGADDSCSRHLDLYLARCEKLDITPHPRVLSRVSTEASFDG